jgi:hypothetical protein
MSQFETSDPDRRKALEKFLDQPGWLHENVVTKMADRLLTDEGLAALGFAAAYGHGREADGALADGFWENDTEDDAVLAARRKPEQHGGLVIRIWHRAEYRDPTRAEADEIHQRRDALANRLAERDRRRAEALAAIDAEYPDLAE